MHKKLSLLFPTAILLMLLVVLAPPVARASSLIAVQDGAWSDSATWGGSIPSTIDDVTIPSGIKVVNSGNLFALLSLTNYGTFVNAGSISTDGAIVNNGTFNNSGSIILGTITSAATLTNTGTFNNSGSIANNSTITNTGMINNTGVIGNLDNFYNICPGIITGNAILSNDVVVTPCPPVVTPAPAPPPDDRLNWREGDTYAVLYARRDSAGGPAIQVYCVDSESHGTIALVVTGDDLKGFSSHPAHNALVKEGTLCHARFYILTTGEYQINTGPGPDGKQEVFIFDDLYGSGLYWRELAP